MNQSFIQIFENSNGRITIGYASSDGEDNILDLDAVMHISIEKKDLKVIGQALLTLVEQG